AVILLSDGKPNDYDHYEGNYGIQDIRKAVKKAEKDGITTYALTADSYAKFYLPLMLGKANYEILHHPEKFSEAMLKFFQRLI
ncbi:MAG TPA: hypothetical protein PK453_09380, partial [Leptospiraceae bacterium]|nr:hypothetical protein [Leptospiraceae bacterium]